MHTLIQGKLENLDLPVLPITKATTTLSLQTNVSPIIMKQFKYSLILMVKAYQLDSLTYILIYKFYMKNANEYPYSKTCNIFIIFLH